MNDTIIALATPVGVGAIGVIRLSGPDSLVLIDHCFSKDLSSHEGNTLHYGKIYRGSGKQREVLDEVVVSLFRSPHSYTGEDVVEISCHGSPFILQTVLENFIDLGARLAKAGEFTQRAFLNGKLDLVQAEAVADLISAESEVSRTMAIRQMRGGFSMQIKNLRQQLIDFASLIELELDFGEEDVEFADRKKLLDLVNEIKGLIDGLKSGFSMGNVLKKGVTTVIIGKPNAGKSTILNALLKEDRAIVSDVEGTTRDTIEETLNVNGVQFRFVDTAGIRSHAGSIEKEGILRTFEKIRSADLVFYIFDVNLITENELKSLLSELEPKPGSIIPVANKLDLFKDTLEVKFPDIENLIGVSGKTGDIGSLMSFLEERSAALNRENTTLVNNARHYEALRLSSDALQEVIYGLDKGLSGDLLALDIRKALYHLGEITGEVSSEDLLANIFSRFCIGK
ncbi:MAG: tRNA uridine-5-carboxymethylaminomethyl(34) synthesis GTPase MnmE [Flavobacteriales bacterium]|nr:tRNA uridine-5-carboxymethylaminomethyl(34) synthesis GTPase MnmE [Flavobacteriales bacterium]